MPRHRSPNTSHAPGAGATERASRRITIYRPTDSGTVAAVASCYLRTARQVVMAREAIWCTVSEGGFAEPLASEPDSSAPSVGIVLTQVPPREVGVEPWADSPEGLRFFLSFRGAKAIVDDALQAEAPTIVSQHTSHDHTPAPLV